MRCKHPITSGLVAALIAVALAGCGDSKEAKEKSATQVAAKVNNDEITVHQLNFELTKLGAVDPALARERSDQVLKTLVDQQLLTQKAIQDKLDRDPQVMQSVESARRQIYAQALLQRMTANVAQPSESEIADYYRENPHLFSERRIYRLQEIGVKVAPDMVEEVKAQLAKTRSLAEFADWLKTRGLPMQANQSTRAAEQLPLELLPRLHQMKDGQALTLNTPDGLNILVVAGSQSQPIALEQARPVIERFLLNTRKRELAEREVGKLREAASIEYKGEYVRLAAKGDAPAQAATSAPPAIADTANTETKAIEQGMTGLR